MNCPKCGDDTTYERLLIPGWPRLTQWYCDHCRCRFSTGEAILVDKVERLREALGEIAAGPCCQTEGCCIEYPMCDAMMARATLAEIKCEEG